MKKNLRTLVDGLGKWKFYLIRGHSQWFALALTLVNFTVIFYKLLVEDLNFVPTFLRRYWIFTTLFITLYIAVSTIVGKLDYEKGTFKSQQKVVQNTSPIWEEVFNRLERLEEKIDQLNKKE